MKESSLWQYIRQGMLGKWHATRIESSSGNGVPDVSFGIPGTNGWMELKYIKEWPVRDTTKVKLPLRPEQKHWIKVRGCLSGNVWVLIRIENNFFLLDWGQAVEACDGWRFKDYVENSTANWVNRVDFDELAAYLEV